jgi:predicted O-methyltransferase YrrM
MPARYEQLHKAVREKQPKAILEVGTWNGMRALHMLNLCPTAKYYGFDLFEDATAKTDAEEFNVKAHHYREAVLERLTGFDVELYKGNTRETLKNFDKPVDFVWIDGGHSVETIRSDWENVKRVLTPDAWVFFDDYFEGPMDTKKVGCNEVVKDLKHEILPVADWVKGGGTTRMVRVWP